MGTTVKEVMQGKYKAKKFQNKISANKSIN
jgi:hypothetical protein